MNRDGITVAMGAALGLAAVWLVMKARGGIAGIPDRISQGLADLGNWVSPGGLVTTAPNAGRVPDWQGVRDTAPLTAYFRQVGNTWDARKAAEAKGWTLDEIGLAVAAMTADPLDMWIP